MWGPCESIWVEGNIRFSRRKIWAAVAAGTLSLWEDTVNSTLTKRQTCLREPQGTPTSKGHIREEEPAKRLEETSRGRKKTLSACCHGTQGKGIFQGQWLAEPDTDLYLTFPHELPHLNLPTNNRGVGVGTFIIQFWKRKLKTREGRQISQGPASHWQTKFEPRTWLSVWARRESPAHSFLVCFFKIFF